MSREIRSELFDIEVPDDCVIRPGMTDAERDAATIRGYAYGIVWREMTISSEIEVTQ
jgi:hypothetical protein